MSAYPRGRSSDKLQQKSFIIYHKEKGTYSGVPARKMGKPKRALIVATIASFISFFEMNDIRILQDMGYEVHLAADFYNGLGSKDYVTLFKNKNVMIHQVDFKRSPLDVKNIKCISRIQKIINDNQITLVHCHTPVGGVVARLATRKYRKTGCRIVYTAHGLQFCKGESLKNWVLFFPVEKVLSRITDAIVTINHEDYQLICKRFNNKKTFYIPGVGINTLSFSKKTIDKVKKRNEIGARENDIIVFSSGELTKRKNHQVIIKAIAMLKNPGIQYFIAGDGPLKSDLEKLAEQYGVSEQVHLLGFRDDIKEILECVDIFAFPSVHEGFGISLLEAMATGLACTATNTQGIKDLIPNKDVLHSCYDEYGFAQTIDRFIKDSDYAHAEGEKNRIHSAEFDIKQTEKQMCKVYQWMCNEA